MQLKILITTEFLTMLILKKLIYLHHMISHYQKKISLILKSVIKFVTGFLKSIWMEMLVKLFQQEPVKSATMKVFMKLH